MGVVLVLLILLVLASPLLLAWGVWAKHLLGAPRSRSLPRSEELWRDSAGRTRHRWSIGAD